jgi:8-oxo-dGTP pyrophosphatase MutT (NUDIX family)
MSSERRRTAKGGSGKSKPRKAPAAAKGGKGAKGAKRKPAKTGRRKSEREFSAGGVVVRDDEVVVIVPTRRAADGSKVLALPKGHVDPGETPVQAAEREVREETGVVGELVQELGETRYWYRRDGQTIGKSVSFFLFSYVKGDIADHDDEVEEVRWIGLAQAQKELSHAAERDMVALAEDYLHKDR